LEGYGDAFSFGSKELLERVYRILTASTAFAGRIVARAVFYNELLMMLFGS
jgi:hypothetical protein